MSKKYKKGTKIEKLRMNYLDKLVGKMKGDIDSGKKFWELDFSEFDENKEGYIEFIKEYIKNKNSGGIIL